MSEREYKAGDEVWVRAIISSDGHTKDNEPYYTYDKAWGGTASNIRNDSDFKDPLDTEIIDAAIAWANEFARPWSGASLEGEPIMMGKPAERDLFDAIHARDQAKLDATKPKSAEEIATAAATQYEHIIKSRTDVALDVLEALREAGLLKDES